MRSWADWTERRVRGALVEGSAILGVEGVRVLIWMELFGRIFIIADEGLVVFESHTTSYDDA